MEIKDLGQLVATRAIDDLQESNKKFGKFLRTWRDHSVTTILFPGEY